MVRIGFIAAVLVALSFAGCGGEDKSISKPANISAPPPPTEAGKAPDMPNLTAPPIPAPPP